MNTQILNVFLILATIVMALAIAATGMIGVLVWLAGGKPHPRKERKIF